MRAWKTIRLAAAIGAFATAESVIAQETSAPSVIQAPVGGKGGVPSAKPRPAAPNTYGTTYTSYYVIDSSEFNPIASTIEWSGINNFQLRYLTNSTGLAAWAPLHLPAGALVTYIEIDYYDNSATGELQAALAVCNYTGESCAFQPGSAACSVTICSGAADAFGYSSSSTDLTANGIVIDNFNNRYTIALANTTTDGSTAWSQIIVGYVLQVSPAPSSATFPDVPTTDFGFQYVEALYASGITGGCGGGLYCPDSPVTRRQMAIFIAKALGLQWN